ncbi:putative permease [Rhizobium petrolearium]|nr:putative permease [Neorhizobium petrolearium]
MKRAPIINSDFWIGLEQCSYWVLFPALLFVTMVKADFSNTEDLAVSSAALISVIVMSGGLLLAWPLFHKLRVGSPAFTSLFQTATRWNAFMALAIAAKTFGQQGLTTVGLVMAAITIPLNLINVTVLLWFSGRERNYRVLVYRVVTNPLILSTALGILVNIVDIPIYEPVMTAVELLSQASLSLGLITVGAGLRIMDALKPRPITLLAVFLKLIFFPLVAVGVGLLTGIEGNGLVLLALSASVPTAMNGYLLARQLNGDADLYAAVATLQVAGSFFSIPVIMTLVAYAAAG